MPLVLSGDGEITGMDSANSTDLSSVYAQLAGPTFTGNLVWSGATLRAAVASVATSQTTDLGTYTDLATAGPSVTLTTGTKALVILGANSSSSTTTNLCYMSFAVSGSSSVAASDTYAYTTQGSNQFGASRIHLITGLTAGSNTFTTKYRVNGGVGTWLNRSIIVVDLGS